MYGAIIGDIVGSAYEWAEGMKSKDFPLFSDECSCTDDSVMTVAVASAIIESGKDPERFSEILPAVMRRFGRKHPDAGYGGNFYYWLLSDTEGAYNSFGNGSAMRVSPCGLAADSLEETLELAERSASVTHNHPEGIRGALATAGSVYLAKSGAAKDEIRVFVENNYYPLDFTLDEIRPDYTFDVSCQGSVPQSIKAFLESESYEDAVRTAVSLGGDTDTMAAIAGGIAWSYYCRQNGGKLTPDMESMKRKATQIIEKDLLETVTLFERLYSRAD